MSDSAAVKPPPSPLDRGTMVDGRFKLLQRVPQPAHISRADTGGARVFDAEDTTQERNPQVLVYMFPPEAAELYEARSEFLDRCVQCDHRGLSHLVAHGLHQTVPYLVIEPVQGQSLAEAIARKQKSGSAYLPRTTLSLLKPVCQALTTVHEDLCHGFISPDHIYVEPNGRTRLAGLGVAASIFASVDPSVVVEQIHADGEASSAWFPCGEARWICASRS